MAERKEAGMSEHTPGPWSVDGRGVVATGKLIRGRGHRRIAHTHATTAYRNEELDAENAANARLIAAAPDMLAALEAVNKLVGEGAMTGFNCHDGDWAERLFLSQQATSAAIKKAGGRLGSQQPALAEETSDA